MNNQSKALSVILGKMYLQNVDTLKTAKSSNLYSDYLYDLQKELIASLYKYIVDQEKNLDGHTGNIDYEGLSYIGWSLQDCINLKKYLNWDKDLDSTHKVNDESLNLTAPSAVSNYLNIYEVSSGTKSNATAVSKLIVLEPSCLKFPYLIYIGTLDISKISDATDLLYPTYPLKYTIPILYINKIIVNNLTNTTRMFAQCYELKIIPKFDTSSVTSMNAMFLYCSSLTSIPKFDTSSVTSMSYMFDDCSSLTTIPLLDTRNVTSVYCMFYKCTSLTTVGGFIGLKTDLDMSDCPELTHDSIMNIINNAISPDKSIIIFEKPIEGKLTFGTTNLAKISDEEKKIATDKGWILA